MYKYSQAQWSWKQLNITQPFNINKSRYYYTWPVIANKRASLYILIIYTICLRVYVNKLLKCIFWCCLPLIGLKIKQKSIIPIILPVVRIVCVYGTPPREDACSDLIFIWGEKIKSTTTKWETHRFLSHCAIILIATAGVCCL